MNMVDTRCFAKSAPALLVGASMEFRGASVINAIKIDAVTYPFIAGMHMNMVDRRCTAKSAPPTLLVGACMGFRGASAISVCAKKYDAYPFNRGF
jgi:hypothetical protein